MYNKCYDLLIKGGKLMTVVFSRDTTGFGTGTEIELASYDDIKEGSIQGLGIRHFFEQNELEKCLYDAGFQSVKIEKIFYTDNGNNVSQLLGFADKICNRTDLLDIILYARLWI